MSIVKKNPTISKHVIRLTSAQVSWDISHLPSPGKKNTAALFDIINAWFKGHSWSFSNKCDLSLIWKYAERHGFSGVLGALAAPAKIPETINDKVRQRYLSNILYHEKCMAISRLLQRKAKLLGIPLSFVKGPTLVRTAYQDPGIRAYSDLDVLVSSRDDAWKLIIATDCRCTERPMENGIRRRFQEPGRIKAWIKDWEIEFCYPVHQPGDPLLMLLAQEKDGILKIPTDENELVVPEVDIYFIFLILHISWHLCSRLIWFMDLAAFARQNKYQINMNRVEEKLGHLQMATLASRISHFCKNYIDDDFPQIKPAKLGWNTPFQEAITSVDQISGKISVYHKSGWRKYLTFILSPTRFFLITDAQPLSNAHKSIAARWSACRLMHAFNINNDVAAQILAGFVSIFSIPFCRFIVYMTRSNKNET